MQTESRQHMLQTIQTWLQQLVASHHYTRRWHHPLVGYIMGLLLVGLGLAVGLLETQLLFPFSFPGVLLLFAVVSVAFLWGAAPALFTVLLSLLVLDYLYVPPFGALGSYGWSGILQLLTFAGGGIIIAILTQQREAARIRALAAERRAVLHANQFEATFEAMSDGMLVYDRQGQVLQTNAATRQLFGLSYLSVRERDSASQDVLLQAVQHDEHGKVLPEKRQLLSRLLKGEALTGAKATDVLVRTPDGRMLTLNMSGAPIRGESGAIERMVLLARDVTERRRLERRTAEALEALLAMAEAFVSLPERSRDDEALPDEREEVQRIGQRMAELTNRVVESTHVILLSVDSDEENVSAVACAGFTPEQEQQWREHLAAFPSLTNYIGNEFLLARLKSDMVLLLDGMALPLHTHALPYYVQSVLCSPICVDERLIGMLCVDNGSREHTYRRHEITLLQTVARLSALVLARVQLQRAHADVRANELALREANQRMEQFLSIICHELKTPLTIVKGSLQLAERKVKRLVSAEALSPDEMRRFAPVQALMERARNQIIIQDRLVNDLLDASRVQAHTLALLLAPCNLASIVQEAVEDQRQVNPGRTLNVHLPAEEIPVRADTDRLVQVVTNYLTNALKYSPSDQPIDVSLTIEDTQARVAVRDQGPGLPLEEQEHVWERFYRVPGIEVQSEASNVGLGVGLYVCRTIIELHGGQVGVESRPGAGATFWLTLPLTKENMDKPVVL